MASENLAHLQATLNRFASEVGFSPLVIDGGMGDKTAQAAFHVVGWVGGSDGCLTGGDGVDLCVDAADHETAQQLVVSFVNDSGAVDTTKLMNTNVGINTFLTHIANSLHLDAAANVALVHAPAGGASPDRSAFHITPPPSMGSLDKARLWFRQQPVTMQAGIGIGGGLLALLVFHGFRGKKKTGTAGLRGRRR